MPIAEFGGDGRHRLLQRNQHLALAELLHQRGLFLDQDDPALVDHADAVGHFLGLLDIMGGQDDRRALVAQPVDQLPHVAAQRDVDAGGRLVEEQDVGFVASALAISTRRFMPPESSRILALALVPQRQVAQHLLDIARRSAALPNSRRLKRTVASTVTNMSTANSCGTSPITLAPAR